MNMNATRKAILCLMHAYGGLWRMRALELKFSDFVCPVLNVKEGRQREKERSDSFWE